MPDQPERREAAPQSAIARAWTLLRAVIGSSVFHLAIVASLLLLAIPSRKDEVKPVHPRMIAQLEIAGGAHSVKVKLPPMPFAAHTRQPVRDADATARTILPVEQTHPRMAGGGAPATTHKGDGSGQALRGNGSDNRDVRPAFPIFSPRPPVTDRSLLPDSEEKIVVDVELDAAGQVVSENLVRGMGNKLDQIVLEIVKSWRFQPATVDGKPVPTEAELIFPFNQDYPISDS